MVQILRSTLILFKDTIKAYLTDSSIMYAAGLAYYAVFAIAPLLVVVSAVAGALIGRSIAAVQITAQVQYLVGPQLAELLGELAARIDQRTFGPGATLLGALGLLFSAAGIIKQLDTALNDIWGIETVRPKSAGELLILLRHKSGPFLVVFFLGFLLSLSVFLDTLFGTLAGRLAGYLPQIAALLPHISRLIIPALAFATFAVIYKWLPEARSRWRDIAIGALVTTLLFLSGRLLLLYYLERSETISLFGAVGSLVILLIWVYYSAQIVLFGAEFTKLYADRFGRPITPRMLAKFEE
jgi:membrane protein